MVVDGGKRERKDGWRLGVEDRWGLRVAMGGTVVAGVEVAGMVIGRVGGRADFRRCSWEVMVFWNAVLESLSWSSDFWNKTCWFSKTTMVSQVSSTWLWSCL